MLYIYAFASLLTPTLLLESRVTNITLAPPIGAQSICIPRVCFIYPSSGTSLVEFSSLIYDPDPPDSGLQPAIQYEVDDAVNGADGEYSTALSFRSF